MNGVSFLPPAASVDAERIDLLYFVLVGLGGGVAFGIAVLLIAFAIRYRRGNDVDRRLSGRRGHRGRRLEYAWIGLPLLIFFAFFAWGAVLYVDLHSLPANPLTLYGVGKQWMWKFQHPGGQREINALHLPSGRPVRVVLASQDVIHSFFVPAFRIKQDVVPGYLTSASFIATREGEYHLFCAEYCGTRHSGMIGRVVVLAPERYQSWLESAVAERSLAARGIERFRELGCDECHAFDESSTGPPLDGLYGTTVTLTNGERVLADENYLRTAIVDPERQVRAGFQPVMPSYAGQLEEVGIFELIAYLKALGHDEREVDP